MCRQAFSFAALQLCITSTQPLHSHRRQSNPQVALGPRAKGPISLQVTVDTPDPDRPTVCVLCTLSAGRVRDLAIFPCPCRFLPPAPFLLFLLSAR